MVFLGSGNKPVIQIGIKTINKDAANTSNAHKARTLPKMFFKKFIFKVTRPSQWDRVPVSLNMYWFLKNAGTQKSRFLQPGERDGPLLKYSDFSFRSIQFFPAQTFPIKETQHFFLPEK